MKIKSAIDSSRRDLSGTIIGFVGTSAGTNPFQEYSNPDLRYLTYRIQQIVVLVYLMPFSFVGMTIWPIILLLSIFYSKNIFHKTECVNISSRINTEDLKMKNYQNVSLPTTLLIFIWKVNPLLNAWKYVYQIIFFFKNNNIASKIKFFQCL
jgi:hypothetical protein